MIWYRNAPKPTRAESERMDLIRGMGCIVCALSGDVKPRKIEIQHIVRGNKRLGHWWTIPLCVSHHRGTGWTDQVVQVAISDGRKAFVAAHGYDDLQLWQRLQVVLGMDDTLPATKILPRRLPKESVA